MNISMQTALIVFSLTSLFGLLIMTLIRIKFGLSRVSISYFSVFYFSGVVSPILIIYRDFLGSFVSIVLANSILVIGNIFLYVGIHKVAKRQYFKYLPYLLFVCFLVLMLVFTYGSFNVIARILTLNITVGLLYLLIIINLQRGKSKISLIDEFVSFILLVLLLAMVARVFGVLLIDETSNEFLRFSYDPFFLLIIGIVNLLIIAGILSVYYNDVSEELQESERQLRSLISNLPGFVYRCKNDSNWTMLFLSRQFEKMTGWEKSEVENNQTVSYMDLIAEDDDWKQTTWMDLNNAKESFQLQYRIKTKQGHLVWVKEQGIPIIDQSGKTLYFEGYIMDITEQKKADEKLKYLSYHDALTNIYNRRFIENRIDLLQEEGQYPISIIMGDIDNLKYINDHFGHEFGDYALKLIADSLVKVVGLNHNIARIGGDEFLILIEDSNHDKMNQLIREFESQIVSDNTKDIEIAISIGYQIIHNKEQSLRKNIRQAEDKMYQQKKKRKQSSD